MPPPTPLTLEVSITGYDCGYGGPLRVLPLLNLFQEAAWRHAAALGLGVGHLQDAGRTWMLSRLDLRLDDPPHTGDRVTVQTWPMGVERLFALRAFTLRSGARVHARAVCAYLIVDLAARRPVRPDRHLEGQFPRSDLPDPVGPADLSVPRAEATQEGFRQHAAARHLDDNGHVNNAHLVAWMVDAVPRHLRRGTVPAVLRAEFLREVLEGEVLEARWAAHGDGALSALHRGGEVVARAWSAWPGRG